jgi:CRP-like cAMP-binding protein
MEVLDDMLRNIKFFKESRLKYGDLVFEQMKKYAYLEFVPEGQVLFEYGSIGQEFFVVIEGEVGVFSRLRLDEDMELMESIINDTDMAVYNTLKMKKKLKE